MRYLLPLLLFASQAMADTHVWWGNFGGSVGDWSVASNWAGDAAAVPAAGDHVFIPEGSAAISAGLDQSSVALGNVVIEPGYTGAIGTYASTDSDPNWLILDCDSLTTSGTGMIFVKLSHPSGNIDVNVISADTTPTYTGEYGLYLATDGGGGGIDDLSVKAGYVAVNGFGADLALTVTQLRSLTTSAVVLIGQDATLTNADCYGGSTTINSTNTTADLEVYGGSCYVRSSGAVTAAVVEGGTLYLEGTGTITTLTQNGGIVDATPTGLNRTITTVNHNSGTLHRDSETTTITTYNLPTVNATTTQSKK